MTEDQPMVAGREYNLKCVSWGSLPPAEISWYRRQSFGAKVSLKRILLSLTIEVKYFLRI